MGFFDIFSGKSSTEEDRAKFDERVLVKNIGGIIFVTLIFPSNTSEFSDYFISNIVKIIEKGYPFIKLVPVREDEGQGFTSRYDVQKGYSVANDLFNVEIILQLLDTIAKDIPAPKIILILKEGIYSKTESLPNVHWVYSKSSKYGLVVSTYPLEYKLSQHMSGYYDRNLLKNFAQEFQLNTNDLSQEELYKIFWLSALIFHELGHALGLSNFSGSHDIMCRPTFVHDVFDKGYKMPESGPILNDKLKKHNLKTLDASSPLLSK